MTTPWNHLPNAKHIDRILASLNSTANSWWDSTYDAERRSAWTAARAIVFDDPELQFAWDASYDEMKDVVNYAAMAKILALIAYEDSAHLLDSSTEEIKLLVALGHPYAMLMLQPPTNS